MTIDDKLLRFHIKMDKELKQELLECTGKRAISLFINTIFEKVFHLVEKKDFEADENLFDPEPEQSADLYLLINETYKNKLFQIQDHFKLRSKGAVLRLIIRLYIAKIKKLSVQVLHQILERSRRKWEIVKKTTKYWDKITVEITDRNPYLFCIYNKKSQPLFFII